jgi:hypothetical protein
MNEEFRSFDLQTAKELGKINESLKWLVSGYEGVKLEQAESSSISPVKD